jgi:hypothetical protein
MALTKADIAHCVSEELELTKNRSVEVVEVVLDIQGRFSNRSGGQSGVPKKMFFET